MFSRGFTKGIGKYMANKLLTTDSVTSNASDLFFSNQGLLLRVYSTYTQVFLFSEKQVAIAPTGQQEPVRQLISRHGYPAEYSGNLSAETKATTFPGTRTLFRVESIRSCG